MPPLFRIAALVVAVAVSPLLLLVPAHVAAETVPAANLSEIVNQQKDIAARLDAGEIGLDERGVADLRSQQARVFNLVEGRSSVDELTVEERIELRNALERIDSQLQATAEADDQREVCWREHKLGSRFKQTRCATRAQLRAARSGGQATQGTPRICGEGQPGCGRD